MRGQNINLITVEGFTSIKSAVVELRELNLLVGANGAGKSNFIAALGMLGRIVDGELGLFVGLAGGASALLSDESDSAGRMSLRVEFKAGGYSAALIAAAGDELIFLDESIWMSGSPDTSIGRGHRESRLARADAKLQSEDRARPIISALRGCRVFHFHDTSRDAPVKQYVYEADNLALHPDAGNLAAVLLNLRLDEPELGLHPFAIVQLSELLRALSKRSQIVVATQSVTLMNQFEADELIVVERRGGFSSFERPDQQRLSDWLADYSLGDLWEKNLLGGHPQPGCN